MDDEKEIKEAIEKAEKLYVLLTDKNLNYDAIFNLILSTNNYERQIMQDHIERNHSRSIIEAIEVQFSGNLREILIYMFYNPYELDARLLHTGFHCSKIDTRLIIEIFATRPKWYLDLINQQYKYLFNISLKSELEKKRNKSFYKCLLCLFETNREQGNHLDINGAEKIVEEIFKNGLKTYGTDLGLFKKVFAEKSREDFVLISRVFYKNNPKKKSLYQACDDLVGGDSKELLKALVFAICDPSHYFAHILKRSMVGIGTNTKALNRILALRSEIDIDVIRERYLGETGKTLINDIKQNTSGDYSKFLCMLANMNPQTE